jgi:hypothetical protein
VAAKPAPPTAPPPTASSPTAPPPTAPPPAPATIGLHVAVTPADAKILVDDKEVAADVELPRDGATHKLSIVKAGYETHHEDVTFDVATQRISVTLDRKAPAKGPSNVTKPKDPKTERIDTQSPYGK